MYLVDVPNLLLQDNWDIKVYGFDSNYTKHSASYDVIARTRPENYVYTEEEQMLWEQLDERIDEIEANGFSEEVINKAVSSYLEKNPIEVDLTGYATEEYVDEKFNGFEVPDMDLSDYYTKEEIDNLFSAMPTYPDGNEVGY